MIITGGEFALYILSTFIVGLSLGYFFRGNSIKIFSKTEVKKE